MKSLGSGRGWMALLTWWTKGEMCAQVVYGPRYTKASQHFQNHPSIWPELKCSTKGDTSHTWYTFMDLLPFGCSQWKVGQPDNWTKHGLGGGEDCAELAERGKLNDDHCSAQRKYICERAATGLQDTGLTAFPSHRASSTLVKECKWIRMDSLSVAVAHLCTVACLRVELPMVLLIWGTVVTGENRFGQISVLYWLSDIFQHFTEHNIIQNMANGFRVSILSSTLLVHDAMSVFCSKPTGHKDAKAGNCNEQHVILFRVSCVQNAANWLVFPQNTNYTFLTIDENTLIWVKLHCVTLSNCNVQREMGLIVFGMIWLISEICRCSYGMMNGWKKKIYEWWMDKKSTLPAILIWSLSALSIVREELLLWVFRSLLTFSWKS